MVIMKYGQDNYLDRVVNKIFRIITLTNQIVLEHLLEGTSVLELHTEEDNNGCY